MNLILALTMVVGAVTFVATSPYQITSAQDVPSASLDLENSTSHSLDIQLSSAENYSYIESVDDIKPEGLHLPRRIPIEVTSQQPLENDGVTKVRLTSDLDHLRSEVIGIYSKLQAELNRAKGNQTMESELKRMEELLDQLNNVMLASRPRFG